MHDERGLPSHRQVTGFTLLELMVSLAIMAAVMGVIAAGFRSSSDACVTLSRVGNMQEQGRRAMDRIADELRLADMDTLLITQENGSDRVDFRLPTGSGAGGVAWSSTITVRCEPSTVDANRNGIVDEGKLVRIQDDVTRVLCHYVATRGFSAQRTSDQLTLHIDLLVDDGHGRIVTTPLETAVKLRNASVGG